MKKIRKILSLLAILGLFLVLGLSSCTKTELETFDDIEFIDADKSNASAVITNKGNRKGDIIADDDDDITDDEDDDDEEEEERRD